MNGGANIFGVAERFSTTYPGAMAGVLAMRNVTNPEHNAGLEQRKAELEAELRARFAGQGRAALQELPTVRAYGSYYSRFKKTYHVLLQLESVALKGRPIPNVAALVEAMFMAELKNQMLTAGHDLALVQTPVMLSVAEGSEKYVLLNGKEQAVTPGDMVMADRLGVISSVLHGPDLRTRITPATRQALFLVYAPAGIGEAAVRGHLADIRDNVLIVAPDAEVAVLRAFGGAGL